MESRLVMFTLIKLTSLADSVSTKAGFHVGKIAHDLGLGFTCLRLDHPRQPWLLKISKIIWYITISQPEPDRHLIFFFQNLKLMLFSKSANEPKEIHEGCWGCCLKMRDVCMDFELFHGSKLSLCLH